MSFIEIDKVSFSYPEMRDKALKNINLKIEKGELVLIIGPSGSGKSTLLSMLKNEISPVGNLEGSILIDNVLREKCSFSEIGYLFQDPNAQLVSDKVYDELIYSLRNLNLTEDEINERLGEIVTYLNLNNILEQNVHTLSGGNKQIVNIASLLLMHPKVLILDEPTSQIDPIHYDDIVNLVLKLNKENQITTLITEHRYSRLFYEADKVIFMDHGEIVVCDKPKNFIANLREKKGAEIEPFIQEIIGEEPAIESRDNDEVKLVEKEASTTISQEIKEVIEAKDISFSYNNKDLNLNYINFSANPGEILSIVGSNGCGKTTFLKLLSGIYYPLTGAIKLNGMKYKKIKSELFKHIGYVPQDVNEFFTFDNIEAEFDFLKKKLGSEFDEELYQRLKEEYKLERFLHKHPTDISGGEKQLIIIIIQILKKSKVMILDEPTKGLDPVLKNKLGETLVSIKNKGTAIILVTHDIDFIFTYSDKCSMMFNHKITKPVPIEEFFKKKLFYLPKHLIKARR